MVRLVVICFWFRAASTLETWVRTATFSYSYQPPQPLLPNKSTQLGNMSLLQCTGEADKTGTRWLTMVEGSCTIANPDEAWPFDDAADCDELPTICYNTWQKVSCCDLECCGAYGYPPNTMDTTCCHASAKVVSEDELQVCPGQDLCEPCTNLNGNWIDTGGKQWSVRNDVSCAGHISSVDPWIVDEFHYSVNRSAITKEDGTTGTISFVEHGWASNRSNITWSDGSVWQSQARASMV
jgi:hypothetical protein